MSFPTLLLLLVSIGTLILAFPLWLLTSSRSIVMNVLVGSFGLLCSAVLFAGTAKSQNAFVIPFLISMLFAGRGCGTLWRSRKEKDLRLPSTLLLVLAGACLYASVTAYTAL